MIKIKFLTFSLCSVIAACLNAEPNWINLEYSPAPVDNPLKGLVPYADAKGVDSFPHSMEFTYLPVSAVVTGPDEYDWKALDAFLDKTSRRGMQAVFRFYIEYPGKPSGVPEYIVRKGIQFTQYERSSTPPRPPVKIISPDYSNADLREMMIKMITALGKKYDGDARIGFITAGFLGHWGEWHSYPRQNLFASKQVQEEVMNAYQAAFRKTPVLIRYPKRNDDPEYADNSGRPLGYHDDSFAWSTIGSKSSNFVPLLEKAGNNAVNKWKTFPIGGEIRPEAFGIVFDENPGKKDIQNFSECVKATHVTWLMDSGMFGKENPEDRQNNALKQVQKMGYEFFISQAAAEIIAKPKTLHVNIRIENRGVAPFYFKWTAEYALINSKGKIIKIQSSRDTPAGILPGDEPREWSVVFDTKNIPAGTYHIVMRVQNAMEGGKPVRFADKNQDADLAGWLTLIKGIKL